MRWLALLLVLAAAPAHAWEEPALAARGEDPNSYSGSTVHALFQQSSSGWAVADWSLGAGDVRWSAPELCAVWRPVIPEFCGG